MKNKPPLLVATPRSGSTAVLNIISDNLRYRGYKRFEDPFVITPRFKWVVGQDSHTKQLTLTKTPRNTLPTPEEIASEVSNTLSTLQSASQRVLMKIFPHKFLTSDLWQHMDRDYEFVFLERQNLVDQFLSWNALRHTNRAFNYPGTNYVVRQFTFDAKLAERFVSVIKHYELIKLRYPHSPVLVYEDLVANSFTPLYVMQQMGIHAQQPDGELLLYPMKYQGEREQLITNREEWESYKPTFIELLLDARPDFVDQLAKGLSSDR